MENFGGLKSPQPEGQGRGTIMGVICLLLLEPFYYIALYLGLKNYETHCIIVIGLRTFYIFFRQHESWYKYIIIVLIFRYA